MWNSLPDNVILADNVNQFKNRLDKHWKMHDISRRRSGLAGAGLHACLISHFDVTSIVI